MVAQAKKSKKSRTYFVVLKKSHAGWSNGSPDPKFEFVKAATPKEALEKVWHSKVIGNSKSYNYFVEVHNNAEDYHKGKKGLAERNKSGIDPNACDNPDCPYC